MKAAALAFLLVAVALAGCTETPAGPVDACSRDVCPAPATMPSDVDGPPNGQIAWTFGPDVLNVRELHKTPEGWTYAANRASVANTWERLGTDGTLQVAPLGAVQLASIWLDGDDLWASGGRGLEDAVGLLLRWPHGTPAPSTIPTDLEHPFHLIGALSDDFLARGGPGQPRAIVLERDGRSHALEGIVGDIRYAAGDGPLVMTAEQNGETIAIVARDLVSGDSFIVQEEDRAVHGLWSHGGRFAYAGTMLVDVDDERLALREIDRWTHEVRFIEQGRDPRFFGDRVFLVGEEPGINPELRAVDFSQDLVFSIGFLATGEEWDTDGRNVWWLDVPRIAYEFDDVPNPTPWTTVMWVA